MLLSQHVGAIDAKWTGISRNMEPELWQYFESENMTAPKVALWDQLEYKFGISIEGTGTGDRIYWQMLGGQVRICQLLATRAPEFSAPGSWFFAPEVLKLLLGVVGSVVEGIFLAVCNKHPASVTPRASVIRWC